MGPMNCTEKRMTMPKNLDNEHRFTQHYPDPTAGDAIEHIDGEARQRKLSVLELEFESYVRKRLDKEGIAMVICRGSSHTVRILQIKLHQGTEWMRRIEVISPKGWVEFELRYMDIRRKAGLMK